MKHLILTLVFLSFMPSASLRAQEEPSASIAATVENLLDILYGPKASKSTSEREKQLRAVIDKRYPFDTMVLRALGRNRTKLKPTEINEITSLTTGLIIRTYSKRFSGAKRPTIQYGKTKSLGSGKVELQSDVKLDGSNYQVIYRCAKTEKGWTIYDIIIEGVSLTANYRKQFDDHFRTATAAAMIAKLKDQLNS